MKKFKMVLSKKEVQDMSIEVRVKYLSDIKGISNQRLAFQLLTDTSRISKAFNGKTHFTIDEIIELCEIFHVSLDYIVHGKDRETDTLLNLNLLNDDFKKICIATYEACRNAQRNILRK